MSEFFRRHLRGDAKPTVIWPLAAPLLVDGTPLPTRRLGAVYQLDHTLE